jgi:hypothetical protein
MFTSFVKIPFQAYVAWFCIQRPDKGCRVEFRMWETFSNLLKNGEIKEVARALEKEGFDCLLGGIDLSIG